MSASPELMDVARRVVWFKPPEKTLAAPFFFLAHLMTHGIYEEVAVTKRYFTADDFQQALDNAPPGIFTARAWAYWNTVFGRVPVPPMPKRRLE